MTSKAAVLSGFLSNSANRARHMRLAKMPRWLILPYCWTDLAMVIWLSTKPLVLAMFVFLQGTEGLSPEVAAAVGALQQEQEKLQQALDSRWAVHIL